MFYQFLCVIEMSAVWISSRWIKACFSWYDPRQRAKTVWRHTELFIKSSSDVRQITDSRKHHVIPNPHSWRCANKHTQGLRHAIQKPASLLCLPENRPKNATGAFCSPLLLESPERTYHDLSRQEKSGLRAAHRQLKNQDDQLQGRVGVKTALFAPKLNLTCVSQRGSMGTLRSSWKQNLKFISSCRVEKKEHFLPRKSARACLWFSCLVINSQHFIKVLQWLAFCIIQDSNSTTKFIMDTQHEIKLNGSIPEMILHVWQLWWTNLP